MSEFPTDHGITHEILDEVSPFVGVFALQFSIMENALSAMCARLSLHGALEKSTKFETKVSMLKQASSSHPALVAFPKLGATLSQAKGLAKHRGVLVHWPMVEYSARTKKLTFRAIDYVTGNKITSKPAHYTIQEIAKLASTVTSVTEALWEPAYALVDYEGPSRI